MATKNGTNAALVVLNPPSLIEQGEKTGRMRVHYDEFVLTAALATNDLINMGGLLPAGARVMDVIIDSPDIDSSTAATLTSGWAASADGVEAAQSAGFISSIDVHTAGKTQAMSALLQTVVPGKFKKFASPVQPQIKVTNGGDAVTGTIRQAIYYVVD